MKRPTRLLGLVVLLAAIAGAGCTWGPCGPVFTRSGGPKDSARKNDLKNNADAVKAAASPTAPTSAR